MLPHLASPQRDDKHATSYGAAHTRTALLVSANSYPLREASTTLESVVTQDADVDWYVLALHDDQRTSRILNTLPARVRRVRAFNPFASRPARRGWWRRPLDETTPGFRGLAGLLTTLFETTPNLDALAEAFSWSRLNAQHVANVFTDPLNEPSFLEGVRSALSRDEDSSVAALQASAEGLAYGARLLHMTAALAALEIPTVDTIFVANEEPWSLIPAYSIAIASDSPIVLMHSSSPKLRAVDLAPIDDFGRLLHERFFASIEQLRDVIASRQTTTIDLRDPIDLRDAETDVAEVAEVAVADAPVVPQ